MYLLLYSSIKYCLHLFYLIHFIFSVTIENVQGQSHDLWRYQRYLIVNEFRNKTLLPPPFNTIYWLISSLLHYIKRRQKRYRQHTPGNHLLEFDIINLSFK